MAESVGGTVSRQAAPEHSVSSQAATLLWIGPTGGHEFSECFRFCRRQAAQLAVRRSITEAIRRPAGHVGRIILARPTRQTPSRPAWQRLIGLYPTAEVLAIGGSLCDGEGRTGEPWPGGRRVRFSRWAEVLPDWLAPCGVRPQREAIGATMLVICDRFETAEPYLELTRLAGNATGDGCQIPGPLVQWHRAYLPATHSGFETILWDDSVVRESSADGWRQRLAMSRPAWPSGPRDRRRGSDADSTGGRCRRHFWLATQPTPAEIVAATAGGVTAVLTKPLRLEQLLRPTVVRDAG